MTSLEFKCDMMKSEIAEQMLDVIWQHDAI